MATSATGLDQLFPKWFVFTCTSDVWLWGWGAGVIAAPGTHCIPIPFMQAAGHSAQLKSP